ncbi:MAG TPA: type II secretion system protein GspG [Terriglobia bacterium]|nr:type II secretion system protein GspG [Terriglobia bacterium]
MNRASHLLLLIVCITLCSCAANRLSHDEARRKIAEIGRSKLIPDAVEIRRVVSQSENEAIAEATITLAFQFKRATAKADWRIEAVRLGDRDWISLDELLAAIDEGRKRTTSQSIQQLATGIEKYRSTNGALPNARDIVTLTDILHPSYMQTLVREDGWGNPIIYEVTGGTTFRLVSKGADGRLGTSDDIVVENGRPVTP